MQGEVVVTEDMEQHNADGGTDGTDGTDSGTDGADAGTDGSGDSGQ